MLFNSVTFVLFFATVYGGYLGLRRCASPRAHAASNLWLLLASYVFYGHWDYRFLLLLWLSTAVDFLCAQRMALARSRSSKRRWLAVSLVTGLGSLGFFKYANFFLDSTRTALAALGIQVEPWLLGITLPIGISFYTFQTLSYTLDVYHGRLAPSRKLHEFALYVAFFPQLVAGPIERASRLLAQIADRKRSIDASGVQLGLHLLLWGYFKKVVVADQAGLVANHVFNHHHWFEGLDLLLGVLAFGLQIYADFSGYSDIARGLAKLLGFDLSVNFRRPYLSLGLREFWQRWHVTLSSWFRDYVYIPLGGNRGSPARTARNLLLTMLAAGAWHGAAWHFLLWGFYHGLLLIFEQALAWRLARSTSRWSSSSAAWRAASVSWRWSLTFSAVSFGWLLFRAESGEQVWYFIDRAGLQASPASAGFAQRLFWLALPLGFVELVEQVTRDGFWLLRQSARGRGLLYTALLLVISLFGVRAASEFIYFQF